MNSKLFIGSLALGLLFFAGCTKRFDTINQNPNQPDHISNEQLFLPSIIKNSVRNYSYISQFGAPVLGDYYANQYNSGFDDAFTASQVEGSFLWNFFGVLRDVEKYRILSNQKGDQNNEGVGLVLRCWMFQVMTDNYGDMPYSQAVQGKTAGIFQPAYDKQEDIYYALMDSLKRANTLLATGTDPINSDILMGGSALRWQEFAKQLRHQSGQGLSNTVIRCQALRPSLHDLRDQFAIMTTPVLLIVGDEDAACLETNLMLKATLPNAGLWISPNTGHTINLEEPAAFNAHLETFLGAVERRIWRRSYTSARVANRRLSLEHTPETRASIHLSQERNDTNVIPLHQANRSGDMSPGGCLITRTTNWPMSATIRSCVWRRTRSGDAS